MTVCSLVSQKGASTMSMPGWGQLAEMCHMQHWAGEVMDLALQTQAQPCQRPCAGPWNRLQSLGSPA